LLLLELAQELHWELLEQPYWVVQQRLELLDLRCLPQKVRQHQNKPQPSKQRLRAVQSKFRTHSFSRFKNYFAHTLKQASLI
jgi:hypothetical protein